ARLAKLLVDGLARRIGHGTLWIVGFHLIVGERIDQELLTHVLEEVFLPPTFEHPICNHDIAQIPPKSIRPRAEPPLTIKHMALALNSHVGDGSFPLTR